MGVRQANQQKKKMLLVLLPAIGLVLAKAEVIIETFFENPCMYGSMPDAGSTYRTLEESSRVSCAVACCEDIVCVAYTYPPCVLHFTGHSLNCSLSSQPDAQDTLVIVKQVRKFLNKLYVEI